MLVVIVVTVLCLVLQVLDLMPQADSITKLASRCTYCEAAGQQRAALFSLRCPSASSKTILCFVMRCMSDCRTVTGQRIAETHKYFDDSPIELVYRDLWVSPWAQDCSGRASGGGGRRRQVCTGLQAALQCTVQAAAER